MAETALQDQGTMIQDVLRRQEMEAGLSAAAAAPESIDVGARLGELRKSRGMTLKDASIATGVSASTLSKIERNDLSPTIGTLQRISAGLGIELIELLNEQSGPSQSTGRRSISRGGGGRPHDTRTCANVFLCSDLRQKRMTPVRTRVTARSAEDYKVWAKSEAEIFMTVLEGTVVVHSKLYEPLVLETGDSLYYDGTTEHIWTSQGETDALVLWVLAAA